MPEFKVSNIEYYLQLIYLVAGRLDLVATLTLKDNSPSCVKYDKEMTVVFQYTQREREEMDKQLEEGQKTHGIIKAKALNYGIPITLPESDEMKYVEINSEDIENVFVLHFRLNNNTFHSKEKRELDKMIIEVDSDPDDCHYDWYYVFEKNRVEEQGIILSPEERYAYLAMKLFYEAGSITELEKKEIFAHGRSLNEHVGFHYYSILDKKKLEISDASIKSLSKLFLKRTGERAMAVNKYLMEAGSSINKLIQANTKIFQKLLLAAVGFKQQRLNISGKYPIYLDIDSFLHILTRHVEDFKFNEHHANKDNFQWSEGDVMTVIKKVVNIIDEEYQSYRMEHPDRKYSKYGNQSIYFEGDYYTLHIDLNGRMETFYKNRKTYKKRRP